MKTSAGLPGRKLKSRKPRQARPRLSERTSSSRSSWTVTASMAKKTAAINASVPASPSMLSSRLKAFVIPTSQSRPIDPGEDVVGDDLDREAGGRARSRPRRTGRRASSAPAACRRRRPARPRRAVRRRRGRRAARSWACTPPAAIAAAIPAARPRKMPTPPKVGVTCSLQRSPVGWATSRRASGERRSDQITNAATGRATSCCSGTHAGHGNQAVLDIDEHRAGQVVSLSRFLYGDTHRVIPPLDVMRCPVCRSALEEAAEGLRCTGCGAVFPVEDGIPRMLDDRLPGIAEKRAEIAGWPEMARAEGWYEPDDEVDAHLPYLTRDLGWEDTTWRANEHSFSLLLERYVRPGMRVLEVGAAKAWAAQHLVPLGVEYVATDILADPNIGLGRGAFYEARVGPFARVQADGEHLPFATGSFDLVYCVAALAPRARPRADGRRDGARHAPRRNRRRAERGHAGGARQRLGRGPGAREELRDQRARAHALGVPVGVRARRASSCAASSTPRATTTCATGGSAASCGGCPWSAARRRPCSPRPVTATRASRSLPARWPASLCFLDGLRRPLPLPGALREPLPARPPDAVQGLGARGPLVAAQPADPDGHLRARLLGAVEGRRHRALRALPARRPRALALLLRRR